MAARLKSLPPGIVQPNITEADVRSVVATVNGVASADQQKRCMDWIMGEAARVHDLEFQMGGEDGRRATDFAGGRRYVGHLIRQMLQPETLEAAKNAGRKGNT